MSKSLGNTLSIRELVKRHDPEALRLYLLGTHYRNALEWAEERVEDAARALARLRAVVTEAEKLAARGTPPPGPDHGLFDEVARERARFEAAMDDDFNSPQALGVLFDPESAREQRDSVGYQPRGEPKSGTWTPGLPIENEPPNALRSGPRF
jgi:cysteinyl-tRNA synthetase